MRWNVETYWLRIHCKLDTVPLRKSSTFFWLTWHYENLLTLRYLILVKIAMLKLFLSLILECHNDKTHEDVNHEKGNYDEVNNVKCCDGYAVIIDRSFIFCMWINGSVQHAVKAEKQGLIIDACIIKYTYVNYHALWPPFEGWYNEEVKHSLGDTVIVEQAVFETSFFHHRFVNVTPFVTNEVTPEKKVI